MPGRPAPEVPPTSASFADLLDKPHTPAEASRPSRTVPKAPYPPRLAQPADRSKERRIRRGQTAIAGRFDLHGHTQESAHAALPAFLASQRSHGARCVLVITGKGRMGEGVLRRNFLRWLETTEARALVSGYAQAHDKHGGAGAFYVFLRRL